MFDKKQIERMLFIDIETVTNAEKFGDLSEEMQLFWESKARRYQRRAEVDTEFDLESSYLEHGGLFAEFNRVVCISIGYIHISYSGEATGYLKSIFGTNEKGILSALDLGASKYAVMGYLCGHNIKEFDCPVLARRMVINGIYPLPNALNNYGKKPWETNYIDTMELWRFGESRSYISLALLTHLLNIPSPKSQMNGSDVGRIYWQEQNYEAIAEYCEGDIEATMNVVLRLSGLDKLSSIASRERIKVL